MQARFPLALILTSMLVPVVADESAAPKRTATVELPGARADGAVLLPNQWSLKPVGEQVAVGDFPVNIQLSPDARFAAVLHCGYKKHEVVVLELKTRKIVSRTPVNEAFYGLAFSRDGKRLFCSGSGDEVLHSFAFAEGQLSDEQALALRDVKQRGVPGGIAVASDGTIYVANVWGHSVTRLRGGEATDLSMVKASANLATAHVEKKAPEAAEASPAEPDAERATRKRYESELDPHSAAEPFPYGCVLDEKRARLYVSLWAHASVAVIDTRDFKVIAVWRVEEHPNEMLLNKAGTRLFVANANRNSVSAIDITSGTVKETLVAALPLGDAAARDAKAAPPGNVPNSLALSTDGNLLFVANANINTLAVFDVKTPGKAESLGFIPVGWYPTSVRVTPDGRTLLVANGKGRISKANPHGPYFGKAPTLEYIGGLFEGTISFIPLPPEKSFAAQMREWSKRAYDCVPSTVKQIALSNLEGSPIPQRVGDASPIKYCIYIVKENRTYDQVLGDLGRGNGDPSLTIFGEEVSPNHHALAKEFVCLDNFYVESEVSADGHEWSMGAIATDFVEKHWPLTYGHDKKKKLPHPSEGGVDHAARPANGYLWDRCIEAGVSVFSFGEWCSGKGTPEKPSVAKVKALEGRVDPLFRGFDTSYPDVKRAERFISELHRFEKEDAMPRLIILRLPNDHTSGTAAGKPTPRAQVADNDLAFGQVIEALTKSKFWPQLAVFVVEDDAQNGSDHVDAHRTIAYAISPYVKRGSVDSTLYSTSSMLRTMELILGLQPMTQFDAAAMPMFASFQKDPDLRPYAALPANIDLEEKNARTAYGAKESSQMNFAKEDAADDLRLNEIIWRSVKGAHSPMPAPIRAAFVFTERRKPGERDDD